ncbi:MAG TPA: ABC transporter substrate-binding protein [Candidatus Binatus sp.]|nr:ABC transporter substrate-binding protein [Candidatus Binatus sp.]
MARWFSSIVLILVLLSPGVGLGQIKVRGAYGTPSLSQVVFPLGVQAGMFERQGLNMEPVYIAGRSINILLSGDVQFGFTGGPQVVHARISGADLITIAGLNRLGQMIVAHPSIKSPADLIGKKVGIGVFGTTADYGMRLGLRKLNLRANKEVTFIQVGDVPARIAAVTSGAVHAVVLSSYDKHFLQQYGLRLLAETEDIDFMGSGIMTTESYAKTNRDVVMRLLRGVVDTIRFIKGEPKRTTELLGRIYREHDPGVLARRYQTLLGIYPDYPYVAVASIQAIIDVLKEDGKVKDAPPAQSFLDMSYLRAVEKERAGK